MSSPFQHTCSLLLAIGFGGLLAHTLTSSEAIGYPAGSAVSSGENPIFSTAGSFEFDTSSGTSSGTTLSDVLTAPTDQDLIITDVNVGVSSGSTSCGMRAEIGMYIDGEQVGSFAPMSPIMRFYSSETAFLGPTDGQQTFSSGIRVPAGTSLDLHAILIEWGGAYCTSSGTQKARYSLSGYKAQP